MIHKIIHKKDMKVQMENIFIMFIMLLLMKV